LDAGVVGVEVIGHRVGEVVGLVGSLVMCLNSSWMVGRGCGAWTGTLSSQELAVANGDSTRSINTYCILVKLTDFNHDACLVSLVGMWACLVLDTYVVAGCSKGLVPVPKGFLSGC